ncbi:AHH domain-containing protein [Pedobacter gandavensis]|uniref:HNH endonuclease n=1 Tax=Pedobacter gandavensis TaxID=2679963 RepID=A0ABR6ESN3_9SPHI|nr:AHH domain-containing protein [Pedobacter gandavensis]MBB2148269.1 hypothetical protein [Pedobacter gandavensis]
MKSTLSKGCKTMAYLALLFILFATSCKKDSLSIEHKKKVEHPIPKITYAEFLRSVDLSSLGILAKKFEASGAQAKTMSIGDQNFMAELAVYTDSIQKIVSPEGISYVFMMPLSSPHAISFRNLTVQVKGNKTTAFIATYTPTKKWINDRKSSKLIPYEGDVSFAPMYLEGLSLKAALTETKTGANNKSRLMPNKVMMQEVCIGYTIYTTIAYSCSRGGHMPWDEGCVWNFDGAPDGERAAGYTMNVEMYEVCQMIDTGGDAGGGGGGGGGGSTPTPPPPYNPCDGGIPVVSSTFVGGTTLMALPPNPCDGQVLPPVVDPVYRMEIQTLLSNRLINQDPSIGRYIINNESKSVELFALLEESDFSYESQLAAAMMIKASIANQLTVSNIAVHYSAINGLLPSQYQDVFGDMIARHIIIQSILIRQEHPEYSEWRVYWEASQEIIHLLLDGVGLIPVGGEIADLVNGVIYTIQGDGTNASLSYASALPIAGWWAAGVKFAKKTITLTNGTKTTLKWVVVAGDVVHFGNRSQLRKVLGLVNNLSQAHHIIPWGKSGHRAIQKAAKSKLALHMNSALNGIPLNTLIHNGSHAAYDARVAQRLELIPSHFSPEQTYDEVLIIINDIRNAMNNYPNVHVNQLIF